MRLEAKVKDKDKEAEARLENDKTEEARRDLVKLPKILLATQVTLLDNDNIVTKAIEVMD